MRLIGKFSFQASDIQSLEKKFLKDLFKKRKINK